MPENCRNKLSIYQSIALSNNYHQQCSARSPKCQ